MRRETFRQDASKITLRLRSLIQTYSFVNIAVRFQLTVKSNRKGETPTPVLFLPQKTLLDFLSQSFGTNMSKACEVFTEAYNGWRVTAVLPRFATNLGQTVHGHFLYVENRPISCTRGLMKQVSALTRSFIRERSLVQHADSFVFLHFHCPPGSYDPNLEPSKDMIMPIEPDMLIDLTVWLLRETNSKSDSHRLKLTRKKGSYSMNVTAIITITF